ncbi:hypothetical protein JDV02_010376 [Purpureocillium takamizusanense]|uniref:DUF4387 domain-containing protein n=1 Tax=Purpureocillium takamizusanense TaxID=2060973 RepID=A0A9Q8QQJ7_9HYPO|nr:uncharacterized protein JDV02_010376 [Purpureocillium takamizusanense]UNI24643.1 hypothetical protein JDV02_010376 [Purpureocillium takamizusanense]
MMGYGFNEEHTEAALIHLCHSQTPTALILDSGSTDSGPSKLALGTTTCPRSAYKRDFRKLLRLAIRYKVPILVSSAGGDGTDDHVDMFVDIIREIADEEENRHWKVKTIAIYCQLDKALVLSRLESGKIRGCGRSVPDLTPEVLEHTPRIVPQIGPEPFMDAMCANPDFNVLVSGRAYDPAPYIAFAAYHALEQKGELTDLGADQLGSLVHMGKILECGGLCATPKGMGAYGIINQDFTVDIRPLTPGAVCTSLSVAAHTLYEKTRPDLLPGPGGDLDLAMATFTELSDGVGTRVYGAKFSLSREDLATPYTVKLEGARSTGFRTLMMGHFSDPILIPQIHAYLEAGKALAGQQHQHVTEKWDIWIHMYGFHESRPDVVPDKVFVVSETLAESQAVATSIASSLRVYFAHGSYPGQKATSGTFGMGIGGRFEIEVGECTEFSVYHLLELEKGEERASGENETDSNSLFRWKHFDIGHGMMQDFKSPSSPRAPIPTGLPPAQIKTTAKFATTGSAIPSSPRTLLDIAKVIRSKNAGPFEVTLDVMFDNRAVYDLVKKSDILNTQTVANLYGIAADDISWAGFFDVAMAFKATLPRLRNGKPAASGGFMEDDVHGSQKYIKLIGIPLPAELIEDLEALKRAEHACA